MTKSSLLNQKTDLNCPCGSDDTYANCCGRFIDEKQIPPTPEALMRSRYTAYTKAAVDYIANTMKPPASNNFDLEEAKAWAERLTWIKLDVIRSFQKNDKGFVEFNVCFREKDHDYTMHELSEFHQENGRWFYVDSITPKNQPIIRNNEIGRNDPCPCGSGKKYKKCCY